MKYRIRKKVNKYMLERSEGLKWEGRTLKPGIELWNLLCPPNKAPNVSKSKEEVKTNSDEKFLQDLLTEPLIIPKIRTQEPNDEEIEKSLYEMSK